MQKMNRFRLNILAATGALFLFTPYLFAESGVPLYKDPAKPLEKRIDDLLNRMTLEEKIDELCGKDFMDGKENKRLGIPPLLMTDGPHGIRDNFGASTCFPTLVTLASTWDMDVIRRVGVAMAQEARAKGRNVILGPCINIHRTPLGGRNFESLSEDPYLVAKAATAYVTGVQSEKIGTSTKHFAVNNQEWERSNISVEIDERALREIYLPGFEAAVKKGKTLTVMGAYNMINGSYCCENSHLLKDILKKDWGFQGLVVSDWWAIHDSLKAAREGCDMEMPGPGNHFIQGKLLSAVNSNQVNLTEINDKVKRILRVKYLLGLFDGEDKKFSGSANTKEHQSIAREAAESGMILLKNEKGILPLNKEKIKSIAVIGPNAKEARLGGGGSSHVGPPYSVGPLLGLQNKCKDGIQINYAKGCNMPNDLDIIPDSFLKLDEAGGTRNGLKGEYFDNPDFKGTPLLTRTDKNIDFDWGGNAPDPKLKNDNFSVRWTGKLVPPADGSYELCLMSDDGSRLFVDNTLLVDNWGDHAAETKKKSIPLQKGHEYNVKIEYYERGGGAAVKFGWIKPGSGLKEEAAEAAKNSDVAIVFAGLNDMIEGEGVDRQNMFFPAGQDDLIEAVAQANPNTVVVLVNGTPLDMRKWVEKVPTIIEAWYPGMEGGNAIANVLFGEVNPSGKLPVTLPKKLEDNPSFGNYPGGGRKVFYKEGIFVGYRHYDKNNVEPLFPFGHGLSYTTFEYGNLKITPGKPVKVSMEVKNSGTVEGKEVVQLYVNDKQSSLPRPPKELKAFEKVNLKPGEKKIVNFELSEDALSFYDPVKRKWVAEPGEFEFLLGSSSRDIRLKGSFTYR